MSHQEISKPVTVDEAIINHLRTNFGSIMTEDQLCRVFDTAINKILFKPRHEPSTSVYHPVKEKPPLVEEALEKLLEPLLMKHLARVIAENEKEILKIIEEKLIDPEALIISTLGRMFSSGIENAKWQIQTQVEQIVQNNNI